MLTSSIARLSFGTTERKKDSLLKSICRLCHSNKIELLLSKYFTIKLYRHKIYLFLSVYHAISDWALDFYFFFFSRCLSFTLVIIFGRICFCFSYTYILLSCDKIQPHSVLSLCIGLCVLSLFSSRSNLRMLALKRLRSSPYLYRRCQSLSKFIHSHSTVRWHVACLDGVCERVSE